MQLHASTCRFPQTRGEHGTVNTHGVRRAAAVLCSEVPALQRALAGSSLFRGELGLAHLQHVRPQHQPWLCLLHCAFGTALPTGGDAGGSRGRAGGVVVGVLEALGKGQFGGEWRARHLGGYFDVKAAVAMRNAEPAGLAAVAKNCLL
jgi:hypothetical protein